MRIGICTWSFTDCHAQAGCRLNPFVPEDLAQLAVAHGLRSVECGTTPFEQRTEAQLAAFRQHLADLHLDLVLDTGGARYSEDTSSLRRALELAHRLGARAVRITISGLLEGDRRELGLEGWKAYLRALVEPLRNCMSIAEQLGVHVGIENHQDATSWELIRLCQQVGSPHLGVTMDVANALSVGETPAAFAGRVLPYLKHVHLKDYTVHPSPSGYRLRRCALGSGVVDWPAMLALFDQRAPQVLGCVELGASVARHIRIYEDDFWATYPPRPLGETVAALRELHAAARPSHEEWRTPHEQGADASARAAFEIEQFSASVAYLRRLGAV